MARRGPTKEKKEGAPAVAVKSQGKVNRRMSMLADMFRKNNEGMDCRYVYHPQHKPDMSNVVTRQADGYRLVRMEELGSEIVDSVPGSKPDDLVRVGDVVLMAIAADVRQAHQDDLADRASAELTRVEEQFYDSIDSIKTKDEYKPRARGRSVIEEVEREVDGPDSHKAD